MAIATLGTQQPGQDYDYQKFEYTPVAPPDPMEELYKQAFAQLNPPPPQPRGPVPFWENPATYYPPQQQVNQGQQIRAAQEMIAQAMQYQGIRGYQRDLESGKSAAEAMAKWGPMLFAQDNRAFAPSMNALTPPPTKPQMQWIPANPQTGEPAHWSNTQSIVQPRPIAAQKSIAPKLNPVDDAALKEANRNISVAMGQLKKPDLLPADREQALGMLNLARTERNKIAKKYGFDQSTMGVSDVPVGNVPPQMPQAPPAPVTAETAAAPQAQVSTPFKEGTRVRNKNTGKYFRIVNGQPVPE